MFWLQIIAVLRETVDTKEHLIIKHIVDCMFKISIFDLKDIVTKTRLKSGTIFVLETIYVFSASKHTKANSSL